MADWRERALTNGWLLAGAFGALFFLIVAGPGPLNPANTDWIFRRDDITGAYLGWTFYRTGPWADPIASNPGYGIDFAGSILYADAIPIMALPFKALAPILPEPFQYFGLWAFISFVLQGVFGWLLMSRATDDPRARLVGALLISVSPVYAYRLLYASCTHISLTAHWLVLAALFLCLSPNMRRPWLWWGLLVAAAAFTHAYLFCMVAALWIADLARRAFIDIRAVALEASGVAAAVAVPVSVTGVWSGPSAVHQGGFGWFKMNAFAFFDPSYRPSSSYSYLLPDIPNWGGDYEGFAFLGLGGLILIGVALWAAPAVVKKAPVAALLARYWPLTGAVFGMAAFALSRNITFGTVSFWAPWPEPLHELGQLFRATGRFIWPLYYMLFFLGVWAAARRFSAQTLTLLLGALATVQAVDTSRGWLSDGAYLRRPSAADAPRLASPFWREAGARYDFVRLAPHENKAPHYAEVAIMARANGMGTDAVYLARTATSATHAAQARIEHGLATGDWPGDTLFVLDEALLHQALGALDTSRHFLARVDGLIVLAPDWAGCADCGAARIDPEEVRHED